MKRKDFRQSEKTVKDAARRDREMCRNARKRERISKDPSPGKKDNKSLSFPMGRTWAQSWPDRLKGCTGVTTHEGEACGTPPPPPPQSRWKQGKRQTDEGDLERCTKA